MRPMPVVAMEPTGELVGAMGGSIEGRGISPLAQGGLDEALGLAVGPGGVGAGAHVPDPELATARAKGQAWKQGPLSVMTRWSRTPKRW